MPLVAALVLPSLKTLEAEACDVTENRCEASVGLSEPGVFIIVWNGLLPGKGRKEGSLAEPRSGSQRTVIFGKERGEPATATKTSCRCGICRNPEKAGLFLAGRRVQTVIGATGCCH